MEEVAKLINTEIISLKPEQIKNSNKVVSWFVEIMLPKIEEISPLFRSLYSRPFYGGSFFNNLKIEKPDEFDMDLVLVLPKLCETHRSKYCDCISVVPSDIPGFFWFKVKDTYYKPLERFCKNGFMQVNLVLNWLKSLLCRTLAKLNSNHYSCHFLKSKFYSESGPALTLKFDSNIDYTINMDIVPAFQFEESFWPRRAYMPRKRRYMGPRVCTSRQLYHSTPNTQNFTRRSKYYRANTSSDINYFFLVPKKVSYIKYHPDRYWRASFQAQEQELIRGKERIKPGLRLLKKTRDSLGQDKISSYALTNIVLWALENRSLDCNRPLYEIYIKLLKMYQEHLNSGRIPYFWYERNNLLYGIHPETLKGYCNQITNQIESMSQKNPLFLAEVILNKNSLEYRKIVKMYSQNIS